MNTITVTTQAELDAAIAASPDRIEIRGNGEFFVRGHTTVYAAYADATVYAYDNSKVYAYADATTVRASDTVVVRAYGNSKVVDARTPRGWAQFNDLAVVDGTVTLYKALEDDLVSGKDYIPTTWPTSGTLTATDWDPEPRCGGGLHLSPTIEAARSYRPGAPRYLKCTAVLDDIVPISTDKCKVATVIVVEEVSREGEVVS